VIKVNLVCIVGGKIGPIYPKNIFMLSDPKKFRGRKSLRSMCIYFVACPSFTLYPIRVNAWNNFFVYAHSHFVYDN
jgi:hypothetical protein